MVPLLCLGIADRGLVHAPQQETRRVSPADHDDAEAAEFGPILRHLHNAILRAMGPNRLYVCAVAETSPHFHMLLVPRNYDAQATGLLSFTPRQLNGPQRSFGELLRIFYSFVRNQRERMRLAAMLCRLPGRASLSSLSEMNEIGRTAFFVNELRSREAQRANPKLFDDVYSSRFSTDATRSMAEAVTAKFPFFLLWMGARTRYIDDRVRAGIRAGATQLVLLGSGLDSRALRFPQLKTFEVDQPSVLEYKRKVLPELPSELLAVPYPPGYVGADVLGELEANNGFDRAKPTIFIWEGNNMYVHSPFWFLGTWLRYMQNATAFACLRPLLRDTSAAMVLMDTLTARIARPDGRVDTGDAAVDSCLQSLMDTLGGGKNVWIGPWDVASTADDLGFVLQDSTDALAVIEDVYGTTNIAEDLLDGDPGMAHIVTTITREKTTTDYKAMEDDAAVKAEAASIVAAARKDQEERAKAQEAAKNAKTPEELQALINSRLKSSMAGRSSVLSQPAVPPPSGPGASPMAGGTSASIKAEAAAVVATAQRERNERIAAQKAVKTASPEELQAMINARLSNLT
ncbi:hypothetical protein CTAYLR_004760 [Chrysophaeum taylorii]|uniref:S-adenosyl-L-methionine-dependent methyltransferase n=1 Tax=Chrysophaeum taylorii TaxID=2483200 RepID=A0AAD7U8B7_9STRA|nr:hypothetical protein CTAYLR_004760 [Chrysophaeum taylorii]